MTEGTASTSSRDWSGPLERALVFGSAGAAVGLVASLHGIWLHEYLELGFLYTVARSLAVSLAVGAVIGVFLALTVGAVVDNVAASSEKLARRLSGEGWLTFCRERALRKQRAIMIGAGSLLFALLHRYDENAWANSALAWAASCGGLVALALFAAGRLRGRAAGLASASSLALVYGWALLYGDSYGRADLAAGEWGALLAALLAAGLVFGIVEAGLSAATMRSRLVVGLPLALLFLVWPLHWLRGPTLESKNPKNVVLIGVDTLRFDHTGLGSANSLQWMPALGEFAAVGALFTDATSQAPWTLPSFASVMTGLYPHEHGAISLQGLLRPQETTLAEVLREAGYQTSAVVSHVYVDSRRGFDQGFDQFDMSQVVSESAITGDAVTDAALAWLEARGDGPFFLFVHYFDPHFEYRDHADFSFADGYRGKLDVRGISIQELRDRLDDLTPADIVHLQQLYQEEVAYTDRAIGRLLKGIDLLADPGETAIVIVADHGEELMERGWVGHTVNLHQEVVHVPLLLRLPGVTRAGQRIDAPVETRALHATLLDYLDLPEALAVGGVSLLPLLDGSERDPRTVFSSVWLPDAPEESGKRVRRSLVRRGSWKLVRDHDLGRDAIYDLATDPNEQRDRAGEAPAQLELLSTSLDAWLARMHAAGGRIPMRELSDEERKRLEALGYL